MVDSLRSLCVLLALVAISSFVVVQAQEEASNENPELNADAEAQVKATMEKINSLLDPSCLQEIQEKGQTAPNEISNECKTQYQEVVQQELGAGFVEAQKEAAAKASKSSKTGSKKKKSRSKRSKKKEAKAGAMGIILGFIAACTVGLLGLCFHLNRKLSEAGIKYYDDDDDKKKAKKNKKKQ